MQAALEADGVGGRMQQDSGCLFHPRSANASLQPVADATSSYQLSAHYEKQKVDHLAPHRDLTNKGAPSFLQSL